MSRKLRPRKLRPQTRKTQTLGCLVNSDLEKTQTLGCLENSDPKNSDPWMSRKLRPEKLRPSGCLENSDPKNKTYLPRVNAASRLVYCSLIQCITTICREKKNSHVGAKPPPKCFMTSWVFYIISHYFESIDSFYTKLGK